MMKIAEKSLLKQRTCGKMDSFVESSKKWE